MASQTPSHSSSDSNATITTKTASARISLPALAPMTMSPERERTRRFAGYDRYPEIQMNASRLDGLGSNLSFDGVTTARNDAA